MLAYPHMVVRPAAGRNLVIVGTFRFSAQPSSGIEITDSYNLRLYVPDNFPQNLPEVTEVDQKIPRDGQHHVNSLDGTLCLGSPLRLLLKLSIEPTLSGFAAECLVPYLYAISHKLRFGGELPFSELAHGTPGALQDYTDVFRLKIPSQAKAALSLLGIKTRLANKLPCPCGCGRRVNQCSFNERLRLFRGLAGRKWYRLQLPDVFHSNSRAKDVGKLPGFSYLSPRQVKPVVPDGIANTTSRLNPKIGRKAKLSQP